MPIMQVSMSYTTVVPLEVPQVLLQQYMYVYCIDLVLQVLRVRPYYLLTFRSTAVPRYSSTNEMLLRILNGKESLDPRTRVPEVMPQVHIREISTAVLSIVIHKCTVEYRF
jgi:hypothetical protein